jgi:hypothetical protein
MGRGGVGERQSVSSQDFEREWFDKLRGVLRETAGEDVAKDILVGREEIVSRSAPGTSIEWTRQAITRLDQLLDEKQKKKVMTACACRYPKSNLEDVNRACRKTKNVNLALEMLQQKFITFLKDGLNLGGDVVKEVVNRGWGLAGVRKGDTIIATKIPKSGSLVEYFEETDPDRKRRLYCHCPIVRDSIGADPSISATYCYCGAGFYKAIWEYILEEPVDVDVLESVLGGGDVCRIAVRLGSGHGA